MRLVLLTAALALGAASPARAQPPPADLSGEVRPRVLREGLGTWDTPLARVSGTAAGDSADTLVVARIVLTRLRNGTEEMMCVPGPAVCRRPVPLVAHARGTHGRYGFWWVPEGEYQMRVEAAGCAPVDRHVVILSHARSVEHVALTCTPNR